MRSGMIIRVYILGRFVVAFKNQKTQEEAFNARNSGATTK